MPVSPLPRRPRDRRAGVRIGVQAAVLAAVVAGTTGFTTLHKQVLVQVDGHTVAVTGFGRTVGDVLAGGHIAVADGDAVVPGLDQAVGNGDTIVVEHGQQVHVEVDGQRRTLWTTARTVGGVVDELGLRDARASALRSSAVGRGVLRVSTPKDVRVAVDGATHEVHTAASTVREVLADAGVVLGAHDLVSVPLDTTVVDGLVVMVTRVTTEVRTRTVTVPFSTVKQDDASIMQGTQVVASAGSEGREVETYEAYLVGGAEVGRTVLTRSVLATPVDRVIKVGTKQLPQVAAVAPGTARAIGLQLVLARGWSQQEFACLDSLWTRESNWRVDAHNVSSGAYGIPQALPGSKMGSVGADWRTNPATQITWGLNYIAGRYGTPCAAWAFSNAHHWY
ncbi:ubiquitin-like domain-containing protein [Isoptericola sp. b441]|uniref:Ubiquitin-like domain-containing protein n=1 Tax=Actinotalea lenta TaxID=3064654 RepID=A0ABT9D7G4_9CELL|nr:ubiquitin-like domain-containing protein [Isoptericola sp. b441]MDO8106785.1 ubiquitin-like domain-containing protein [Isoptericola sp. b441]